MPASHFSVNRADFAEQRHGYINYIDVMENDSVTMAIFVIPPGGQMPVHNHPGMYVVSRVLWGCMDVHEFQVVAKTNGGLLADAMPIIVMNEGDTRAITPTQSNIHQFKAREWTAVFDVLVPPYEPRRGRDCNYFQPHYSHSPDHVYLKVSLYFSFSMLFILYIQNLILYSISKFPYPMITSPSPSNTQAIYINRNRAIAPPRAPKNPNTYRREYSPERGPGKPIANPCAANYEDCEAEMTVVRSRAKVFLSDIHGRWRWRLHTFHMCQGPYR